jgi:DNA-3-methyladenine glycosylase
MRRTLSATFLGRSTVAVARGLLGKYLVRRIGRRTVAGMIVEVEAYDGPRDRASHASRGVTPRNAVMFGPPGYWYVYFTYGMHWILNVVTGRAGYPAAVLIRGIEGTSGPARVTKSLRIGGAFDGKLANRATGLWLEDRGVRIPAKSIKRSPRIGVGYAGPVWSCRKYRFSIEETKGRSLQ